MSNTATYLFYFFAALILAAAVASVTSRRILRAAVYLLFVLGGTAAFYFMVDYAFLAAVQLLVYAGGIVVLIIFSILLTSDISEKLPKPSTGRQLASLLLVTIAFTAFVAIVTSYPFAPRTEPQPSVSMRDIGSTLLSYGNGGYVLPFEVISLVLLAALAGAVVIAKRNPPAA